MKHLKKLLIIILILSIHISCNKSYLDVPDKSVLLRQAYVTDLRSTEEFTNGIYVDLASVFYHGYSIIYPELIADNAKPIATVLLPHYSWAQKVNDSKSGTGISAQDENMNALWLNGYRLIRSCSFIIDNIDKYRDENTEKADNLKGQAFALRALLHFVLTNVFAQPYNFTPDASHSGIPYITTSNVNDPISRQTVVEVYTNMSSDLNKAIQLLPLGPMNVYTFNKNAAKALLARVSLFKGDFETAKNLAKDVSTNIPLMPAPAYPSKLFTSEETEALFQLPPAWGGAGLGTHFTRFAGRFYLNQFEPTNDIISIFKENGQDIRNAWIKNTGGSWQVRKFPQGLYSGFANNAYAYYQTLLRSSEMYLTAAESYAKLNKEDSAKLYLDAIRLRADPSLAPTFATGSALQDSIYKERRKELAFEGLRVFDLLRWKQSITRSDATDPTIKTLSYPSNKAIAPIPASDVNITGLPQNTGY